MFALQGAVLPLPSGISPDVLVSCFCVSEHDFDQICEHHADQASGEGYREHYTSEGRKLRTYTFYQGRARITVHAPVIEPNE